MSAKAARGLVAVVLSASPPVVMVFALSFGDGEIVRIASVPLRSADFDAVPAIVEEPAIKESITLSTSVSAARSLAITIPTKLVNPLDMIKRGLMVAGFAEVYLQVDGGAHSNRLVLIRGEMAGGVAFGAQAAGDELIELDVVDPKASASLRLPPIVVSESIWPDAHKSALGERLPIVIGGYPGVPALRLTSATTLPKWAIADEHGFMVPEVWVNGEPKLPVDAVYGYTVSTVTQRGVSYTEIAFTNPATVWSDGDSVYADVVSDRSFSVVRAIEYLLLKYGHMSDGLHSSLFGSAAAKMPSSGVRLLLNGAGRTGTDAIKYIETGLLKTFPMVKMVWQNGKYGPVVYDVDAAPSISLEVGTDLLFDRTSLVLESAKDSMSNDFVLRYGYDTVSDSYTKVATRNKDNDHVCAISASQIGVVVSDEIETPYIHNDELAGYVLDWYVRHYSRPSYEVEYVGNAKLYILLRRGDTILLTDSELGFDGVRAVVERITYKRGRVVVGFRVWLQ